MSFIKHLRLTAVFSFVALSEASNKAQLHTCSVRVFFTLPLTKAEDSKAAPYLALHHVTRHHLEEQTNSTAVTRLWAGFASQ